MYINTYNPMHKYNGLRRNRIPNSPQCQDWVSGDPFKRGLVGHWKSIGDVSVLGTWYDISGNNNNGTLVDDAYVDSNGVNLNTGDYVDIGASNALLESNINLTFCSWINASNFSGSPASFTANRVITITESTGSSNIAIGLDSTGNISCLTKDGTTTIEILGNTTLSTGIYYFIVLVKNGPAHQLFLNGVSDSSISNYTPANQPDIDIGAIGAHYRAISEPPLRREFSGIISDTRIYNRAISEPEIKQLYNQTKGYYN